MKRWLSIVCIVLAVTVWGCTGSDPDALFDTAKLEERQDNPEHARQLYQRIVDEHPQTAYADKARERLRDLETE